ncbi:hypothetical protein FSP39_011081, partial [Pinctada imbricata]
FVFLISVCDQMSIGVFLFFGVKDAMTVDIVESFTNKFHIPLVSPSLTKVKNVASSFQIHMKPSYTRAIIDMVKHYKWKVLYYVYDSNEGLQRFEEVYSTLHRDPTLNISVVPVKLEEVDYSHEILRSLDVMYYIGLKTFTIDLSSLDAYRSLMRQIAEVGMNREGYFYLFACLDFSKLDFTRFLHGGVNVTGFDIVDSNSADVKSFLRKWRSANTNIYPSAGEPLMSESAMSVDALETIVSALDMMLQEDRFIFKKNFRRLKMFNFNGNITTRGIPCSKVTNLDPPPQPWQHGQEILQALKSVMFNGLTGPVSFDEKGYRKDFELLVSTVGIDRPPQQEPPYLQLRDPKNKGTTANSRILNGDKYEGFILDFAEKIAEELNVNLKFREVSDENYGEEISKGIWNGMVGELRNGTADLAIAPLTITLAREKAIDFTKPFMDVGISIMIKKPDIEKPGVFSFMKPFSLSIWMFILLAYTAVSIGLFLVSRFSPYEWRKILSSAGISYENDFSLINSFWFSTGALMLQGSDECPRSISGRIIGTVWWFFVLIIISTYTANLAAFLTVENMVAPIESADQLAAQDQIKYGCRKSGSTEKFFEENQVTTYRNMGAYMKNNPSVMVATTREGIERVRNSKGKYALLIESTMNEYENSREPCDTLKVGRNLNAEGYGIATPTGSIYRLNLAVLMLHEDGTLLRLKRRWWQDKSQCAPEGTKESSGKPSLSLSNVAGVFYILIGGLVIAVVFGAFQFIVKQLHLEPKVIKSGSRVYVWVWAGIRHK